MIVALPDKPSQVALIDQEKGNIMDIKNKKFVRSIPDWEEQRHHVADTDYMHHLKVA